MSIDLMQSKTEIDIFQEANAADLYIKSSLSDNTKRAYKIQWEQFSAWCFVRGFEYLPAKPETVCMFISWMAENKKKSATIARMLSSISKAHRVADFQSNNPVATEIVKDTFSGIKRTIGTDQDRVDPISVAGLKKIVDMLSDDMEGFRNRALILVGWFGGFRRSELVNVLRKDVKFLEEGVRVKIAKSKTDQEGKGFFKSIPIEKDKNYCPVAALRDWLAVAPDSRYLFCHIDGVSGPTSEGKKLSDKMVARLINRFTAKAELDGRFSGHSLRAGFVTAAARAGKSNRAIMKMTGHKSHGMVDRYVRLANEFEDNAADGIL